MPTPESTNQASEKSSLTPEQMDTLVKAPNTFEKNKELLKTLLTEKDYNFIAEKVGNQEPEFESLEPDEKTTEKPASTEIEELEVEDTKSSTKNEPIEDIPFESI